MKPILFLLAAGLVAMGTSQSQTVPTAAVIRPSANLQTASAGGPSPELRCRSASATKDTGE